MIGLLGTTAQVSAILVVALCMVWLLRKQSASLRHAVIVIAMACAAIVPALSSLMPTWQVGFIPRIVETPIARMQEAFARHLSGEVAAYPAPVVADPGQSKPAAPGFAPRQSGSWRNVLPTPIQAAWILYITGAAFFLLRLMIGLLRLRRIAGQSEPLRCTQWQRRVTAISIAYRLRRTVKLLRSESPLLATWGIMNPQVLLPAGAEHWSGERIRAVLLHELAHIRRNDWAMQLLAGVLCSIYWFNPLVWLALSRMRQESEQACDDTAITQGEDHAGYAGELLALARSLNAPMQSQLPAAPSMALRSTLRQRVAAVLDPATPHVPATARSLTAVSAMLIAVTCAVAACDGIRAPGNDPAQPTSKLAVVAPDPEAPSVPQLQSRPDSAVDLNPGPAVESTPARVSASEPGNPERSSRNSESRSPKMVTASILELVESALADESLAMLDEVQRPITGLHHLQRLARAVADDEGFDRATQAARYTQIINALKNTATFASNVTSAPRGAELPKQKVDHLVAALRERAEELSGLTMPTPRVISVDASTPERRAAISALDLAQSTLRDTRFVGPRSVSWLGNELDTVEMAAQSVLSDDGSSQDNFTAKLYSLRGALLSISRNADNIARRPRASADVLGNARALSVSARRVMNQLDAVMSHSLDTDDQVVPVL